MEQNDVIKKQMKYIKKQLSQEIKKVPQGRNQLLQGEMIFSQKKVQVFQREWHTPRGTMNFHFKKIQIPLQKTYVLNLFAP